MRGPSRALAPVLLYNDPSVVGAEGGLRQMSQWCVAFATPGLGAR